MNPTLSPKELLVSCGSFVVVPGSITPGQWTINGVRIPPFIIGCPAQRVEAIYVRNPQIIGKNQYDVGLGRWV